MLFFPIKVKFFVCAHSSTEYCQPFVCGFVKRKNDCSCLDNRNLIEKVHGSRDIGTFPNCMFCGCETGMKCGVCAMSDRRAVLGSRLAFHIHHTTGMHGGASLQIESVQCLQPCNL